MIKVLNKIYDNYIIKKNLKTVFIVLLFMLFIFVIFSITMLIQDMLCFSEIIAPFIIGLSALLASTVAMISIKTNDINRITDKIEKRASNINYLILQTSLVLEKIRGYQNAVEKYSDDKKLINEHFKELNKLETIFENKLLTIVGNEKIFDLLHDISNDLFFIRKGHFELENNNIDTEKFVLIIKQLENYLDKLQKELREIIDYINNDIKTLNKEEF